MLDGKAIPSEVSYPAAQTKGWSRRPPTSAALPLSGAAHIWREDAGSEWDLSCRNSKVELTEVPKDVRNETQVLVTFIEPQLVDLQARRIDETQATELRARLATFIEDWDSPGMAVCDDYDAAIARLQARCVILVLRPHSDLRMAKQCLDLFIQANALRTGLPQVRVAMSTSRLFRANHPS